jgi:acyl-CoA dehydrogenase
LASLSQKHCFLRKLLGKLSTETAQRVIDAAVQIAGALGVVSEQIVERLYREIRPLRIYEGATEVQQLIVARGIIKAFQESEPSHA